MEIDKIFGVWAYHNDDPNLAFDGWLEYTFNADYSYVMRSGGLSGEQDVVTGLYLISVIGKPGILTLYDEQGVFRSQFNMLKLTSKEMRLENTDRDGGLRYLLFRRQNI